jgi:hypothetical protein
MTTTTTTTIARAPTSVARRRRRHRAAARTSAAPPSSSSSSSSSGPGRVPRTPTGARLPLSPYRVLGVAPDATSPEIKLAYRKLVRTTHPDVCDDADAAATFRMVNGAYEIVGADAARRARFDRGDDWVAMDDGWLPEQRGMAFSPPTGLATSDDEYDDEYDDDGGPWEGGAYYASAYRRRRSDAGAGARGATAATDGGVELADEDRRARGLRRLRRMWATAAWTKWCEAWLAALPVGVPAAVAYFVLVGSIGAGRLGGGGPLIGH